MRFVKQSLAVACCSAILVTTAAPSFSQSTAQMLETAESECIEKAAAEGYDPDQAEVISSQSVDADTVEVVLNLTKDGTNFARLTCPYSASRGIVSFGEDMVDTVASPGLGRLWWLLLPLIGFPLLLWFLRGRDKTYATAEPVRERVYTEGYVNTTGDRLDVREYPKSDARVLRSLNNGAHIRLTGRHDHDWLELVDGGWAPSYYLRFPESQTTYR